MDFGKLEKVDIEKMSEREKIAFQDKFSVLVLRPQDGSTPSTAYNHISRLIQFMNPELNKVIAKYNKSGYAEKHTEFKNQLPFLMRAAQLGYPIVIPDYTKYGFGQEEKYRTAEDMSYYLNQRILDRYQVKLPENIAQKLDKNK